MKTFNVAMLSDDTTMKPSYFFTVKADNPFNAIDKATNHLRGIIIDQYGKDDLLFEVVWPTDFTPEIFELIEI